MERLRQLIHEVHRRSLWQVLGILLLGGWLALEAVQTLTEGLGLPEWSPGGAASGLFTWRNAFGGGVLAFAVVSPVAARKP